MPYTFTTRSPGEVERVISEQDAPRPSGTTGQDTALRNRLAGDLDTITLKALEKDPQRRYSSVEQFADDIRRHLQGLPITARPQTFAYWAGKFARRNRAAVIAAVVMVISLIGGLAATSWQAHIAHRERARAEQRFAQVRRLANTYLFEFHDKIKDITGTIEARRLLVDRALEYLDGLARDAAGDTSLELELAEAYVRLGDAQGNPYYSNLGDAKGALASYDKAVRVGEVVVNREPTNQLGLRTLARAFLQRGDVLPVLGREAEGLASTRNAADRFRSLAEQHPGQLDYRVDLASCLEALGDVLGHPGIASLSNSEAAAEAYSKSLEAWKQVLAKDPKHARARRAVGVLHMKLGDIDLDVERLEAARSRFRQALEQLRTTDLGNPENLRVAASVRRKLAYVLSYDDVPAALAQYRDAKREYCQLVERDPKNDRARMDLAIVLRDTGELQEGQAGSADAAVATYREVLAQLDPLYATDPSNMARNHLLSEVNLRLGKLLHEAGKSEEARPASMRGLKLARELATREGASIRHISFYADVLLRVEPPSLRDPAEALRCAETASNSAGGRNPAYLNLIAEAHFQCGRAKDAAAYERKAIDLLPAESTRRHQYTRQLKRYLAAAGK